MELELGFRLTRVADEFTSDFQIAKDRSGPVFLSRETDAMFILTAHLKGYKRGNINIDINENGTLIGISGERQVQETVMISWQVHKKETEIKSFKKVFKIPDGVILDKILAKFNEDDSTLKITMPKKVKGIRGVSIEEIKENRELVKQGSGRLRIQDEKSKETAREDTAPDEMHEENVEFGKEMREEKPAEENFNTEDIVQKPDSKALTTQDLEPEKPKQEVENQEKREDIHEKAEAQKIQKLDHSETLETDKSRKTDDQSVNNNEFRPDKANIINEEEENESAEEETEAESGRMPEDEHQPREKSSKICIPLVAGSALLLSFVVFVIQVIRSKNQNSRRRD